jgi:PAS domain S-box-containing protein
LTIDNTAQPPAGDAGALDETNTGYRLLVEHSPNPIYIQCEGKIVFINAAGARLFGAADPAEIVGRDMLDLTHPAYRAQIAKRIHSLNVDRKPAPLVQEQFLRLDGSAVDVEVIADPILYQGKPAAQVVAHDITEHKQAERTLQIRVAQQTAVAELGQFALSGAPLDRLLEQTVTRLAHTLQVEFSKVLELSPDGQTLRLRAGMGWQPGIVGHATVSAGPDTQAGYALLQNGPVLFEDLRAENRFRGAPILYDHGILSGLAVVIPGRGGPYGVLGAYSRTPRAFTQDDAQFLQSVANVLAAAIERDRAAAENARWAHIFENAGWGVAVTNTRTGALEMMNPAFAEMCGYTVEELQGRPVETVFAPQIRPSLPAQIAEAHRQGRGTLESVYQRKNGSTFPVSINFTVVKDEAGQPLYRVVNTHDITGRKRAETALLESEKRFRLLYESSPIGYQSLDADGRFLEVNPAWCAFLGYRREEVIGRWFGDFLAPNFREHFQRNFPRFKVAGEIHGVEFQMLRKDGTVVLVAFDGKISYDADGQFKQTHCVLQDIGARRQTELALRASEERYRTLAHHFPNGIVMLFDQDLRHTLVDGTGLEVLGIRGDWVVGLTSREAFPAELAGQLELAYLDALDGLAAHFEMHLEDLILDTQVVPVRAEDGHITGGLVVSQDVTERRAAEAEVRRLNQELEQRVAERTAQLEAANRELEAFSYSVSHDLRAPLRAIDGFSKALVEEYGGGFDEQAHYYISRTRAASQRMAQLIDDLLRLSRVTRAEIKRESVDLSTLAQTVIDDLRSSQPDRTIAVSIEPGMQVYADPRLLRVALDNLLGNAWKFTSRRADARIHVGSRVLATDEQAYFVEDNGAGFDMAYADKLFGAFQRLHDASEFEGTGIGLDTVQRIIRRHSGRVWAEGVEDQGATFFFTL